MQQAGTDGVREVARRDHPSREPPDGSAQKSPSFAPESPHGACARLWWFGQAATREVGREAAPLPDLPRGWIYPAATAALSNRARERLDLIGRANLQTVC
jgi:hypothetical protein